MIRTFKDRVTRCFICGPSRRDVPGFAGQATRRLTYLGSTEFVNDLAGLPGNRLEAFRGGRTGHHGIRSNMEWRICFRWEDDGPCELEIVDDH